MTDWLVLLNEQVSAEEMVAALRSAVPPPWDRLVLLAVGRRWRPFSSGVPASYRAQTRAALREDWSMQERELLVRLDRVADCLRRDAQELELRLVWGDPVDGAHQVASTFGASLIVYPVKPSHWLLDCWPGRLPWRLVRNAPCSVLLAQVPAGREEAPTPAEVRELLYSGSTR